MEIILEDVLSKEPLQRPLFSPCVALLPLCRFNVLPSVATIWTFALDVFWQSARAHHIYWFRFLGLTSAACHKFSCFHRAECAAGAFESFLFLLIPDINVHKKNCTLLKYGIDR